MSRNAARQPTQRQQSPQAPPTDRIFTLNQTPDLPVEIVETARSHNTPVLLGVVEASPTAE